MKRNKTIPLILSCLVWHAIANETPIADTLPQSPAPFVDSTSAIPAVNATPAQDTIAAFDSTKIATASPAQVSPAQANPMVVQQQKELAILDSIKANESTLQTACATIEMQIPALTPKGEFETSAAFTARQKEWEKQKNSKCASLKEPLIKRKADLEKSLNNLQKQSKNFQGNLEITSNPKGASVFLNNILMGTTPLEIENLWSKEYDVKISLNGYQDHMAKINIQAKKDVEFKYTLLEKSIFSQTNEVNLPALLLNNATQTREYSQRILTIQNRIAEIDLEVKDLYAKTEQQSPLTPKGEFEKQVDFDKRKEAWQQNVNQQKGRIKTKYETTRTQLQRAITVLNDYILSMESKPVARPLPIESLTLNSYNADAGLYNIQVKTNESSFQFEYEGSFAMNIEEAKLANKKTTGMNVQLQFYPIAVDLQGTLVFPALKGIEINKANKNYPAQGKFTLPQEWTSNAQIAQAILRADSLNKGILKAQNLTPAYALDYTSQSTTNSRFWMYAVRTLLFSASAASFALGVSNELDAQAKTEDYNPVNQQQANEQLQAIHNNEKMRNQAYAIGSGLLLAGLITFAF